MLQNNSSFRETPEETTERVSQEWMCEPGPSALHLQASNDVTMVGMGVKVEEEGPGDISSGEVGRELQRASPCSWLTRPLAEQADFQLRMSQSPLAISGIVMKPQGTSLGTSPRGDGSPKKERTQGHSPPGQDGGIRSFDKLDLQHSVSEVMPTIEKLLNSDLREKILVKNAHGSTSLKGTPESLAEKELQLLVMINQLSSLRDQLLGAHSEQRNMAALLLEKQQQQMELARQQQEQIAKQQQQLIQQQHKINLLQQQIQQVNMPYVMIPAFHHNSQPLSVTSEPQMGLPLQPIPCKPVDYPMQFLPNPHSAPAKRSSGAVHKQFGLKEANQPLNLTSKPKGLDMCKTTSGQTLEMASVPLQSSFGPRDLQLSPPRSGLSLMYVESANRAEAYKKLSRSAFSKSQALWNKSSRSTSVQRPSRSTNDSQRRRLPSEYLSLINEVIYCLTQPKPELPVTSAVSARRKSRKECKREERVRSASGICYFTTDLLLGGRCDPPGSGLAVTCGPAYSNSSAGCSPASDASSVACSSRSFNSSVACGFASCGYAFACHGFCSLLPSASITFTSFLTSSCSPSAFLFAPFNIPSGSGLAVTEGPSGSGFAVAGCPCSSRFLPTGVPSSCLGSRGPTLEPGLGEEPVGECLVAGPWPVGPSPNDLHRTVPRWANHLQGEYQGIGAMWIGWQPREALVD
ncbi:uncharacterized protein [Paramormyrops kingsleyae]|uniref:uncharacterized protein n=1 Tax=Paramormyrops kingsleyae TaxID=1676925 RepID=UPI003B96F93B